jgi:hypothetical protein
MEIPQSKAMPLMVDLLIDLHCQVQSLKTLVGALAFDQDRMTHEDIRQVLSKTYNSAHSDLVEKIKATFDGNETGIKFT